MRNWGCIGFGVNAIAFRICPLTHPQHPRRTPLVPRSIERALYHARMRTRVQTKNKKASYCVVVPGGGVVGVCGCAGGVFSMDTCENLRPTPLPLEVL